MQKCLGLNKFWICFRFGSVLFRCVFSHRFLSCSMHLSVQWVDFLSRKAIVHFNFYVRLHKRRSFLIYNFFSQFNGIALRIFSLIPIQIQSYNWVFLLATAICYQRLSLFLRFCVFMAVRSRYSCCRRSFLRRNFTKYQNDYSFEIYELKNWDNQILIYSLGPSWS